MKVECVQNKLSEALYQAEKITGKNLNLPVLSCVYIEAKKGHLLLRATNLDLGFQSTVPAKVDAEGIVAVPAGALSTFIANLPREKSVKLESSSTLSVITHKSRSTIKCLPHEDFPTIPELPKTEVREMPAKDFVSGLKAVWYSSSISSIKPELSSVCVYPEEHEMVFAATDSFRLAEKKIKTKGLKEFERVLIPFKNVAEIIRVLERAEGVVEIRFSKHQIAFAFDGTYLTSRVVDGTFPDYRQIIPKEFKTEAVLLKEDLIQSLKISTIFSDAFNQVSMSIAPSAKRFSLTAKNASLGENTTTLDAALSGADAEANFNFRYIADCLQAIGADSVSLSFAGPSRPVVIRGVSDKSFTYLVMPMNR
ncbi:MAG: DNA polymerase III subunit beta [Candidatus Taylorbacteria bacterium]|nr:DNA polymerase III subunit beta [Candidatus Taylorbacteria bacterium]